MKLCAQVPNNVKVVNRPPLNNVEGTLPGAKTSDTIFLDRPRPRLKP